MLLLLFIGYFGRSGSQNPLSEAQQRLNRKRFKQHRRWMKFLYPAPRGMTCRNDDDRGPSGRLSLLEALIKGAFQCAEDIPARLVRQIQVKEDEIKLLLKGC